MPDPIPDPEPLPQEEDDEGTEYEYEDEEEEEEYETEFEDDDYDDEEQDDYETEFEDDDYDDDEQDDYETEFEDEEIGYDDEEGQEEEDYDETEGGELEQQNVQQPLVPQVSRSDNTVDLEASSSPPIVALEEEATNERGRQERDAPTSSGVSVESSGWNRSEIEGLFCPICMEAWTNEGDHHICCLPCGHIYGMSCIKKWLELRKNSAKCPQCNQRCTMKGVRKLYAPQLVTVDEGLHKLIKAHGMRWRVNGKERDLPLMRPTSVTQPPPQSSIDQIMNQLANLSASMQQNQAQILERMDKLEQFFKEGMDKMEQFLEGRPQQLASYRGMIH